MARPGEVISHWHHSVEDFNTSTLEFYNSVEEALRAKEAPSVKTDRIDWHETGLLSAKREYLRVSFGRFSFDICAAPFGKDFFFSWWLTKRQPEASLLIGCGGLLGLAVLLVILVSMVGPIFGMLAFLVVIGAGLGALMNGAFASSEVVEDVILSLPIVGTLYRRFLKPVTYYTEDTRLIFEEAVHTVVLHHVEGMLQTKGARALAPEEARPQSRNPLRA
jgi:hypothetical protein